MRLRLLATIACVLLLGLALLARAAFAAWSAEPTLLIGTLDECRWLTACTDGNGGALLAFQQTPSGAPGTLMIRHLLATGDLDPTWPPAASLTPVTLYTNGAHLLADGEGGAYAWWLEGLDLHLTRIAPNGITAPGWPAQGRLLATFTDAQEPLAVALDASHGVYAAWMLGDYDVRAIHLSDTNTLAGGWPDSAMAVIPPAPDGSTQRMWPHLAPAPNGDVFLAFGMWEDVDSVFVHEIRLQRLTPSGAPAAGWPVLGRTVIAVSANPAYYGPMHDVAPDARGGVFVIACTGTNVSSARLLRMDGDGARAADWPAGGVLFSTTVSGGQGPSLAYWPAVIHDLTDGVFAAVPVPGGLHYYPSWQYRHYDPAGVRTDTGTNGFAGNWSIAPRGGRSHFVSDEDNGSAYYSYVAAYQKISCAGPDGVLANCLSEYHDQSEYMLFWGASLVPTPDGGAIWTWSRVLGQTGVYARRFAADGSQVTAVSAVPPRLALGSVRWSAGVGVSARVSLDSPDGAALALYDVGGRRISSTRIAPGSMGERDVTFPGTRALADGVYFARLVSSTGSRAAKVPVLR